MTNEEAKAIIRKEYLCVDRDCDIERSCGKCDLMMPSKEPILEAYKMAIKALEQEPCRYWQNGKCNGNTEVCEDAISRQAVTDTTICDGISCNECPFNTCEDGQAGWLLKECLLKERVDKLPSVTPQPKTGHWISHHHGCEYECSECHDKQRAKSNYCPNCGCRMFEPQERSDKE